MLKYIIDKPCTMVISNKFVKSSPFTKTMPFSGEIRDGEMAIEMNWPVIDVFYNVIL